MPGRCAAGAGCCPASRGGFRATDALICPGCWLYRVLAWQAASRPVVAAARGGGPARPLLDRLTGLAVASNRVVRALPT